MPHEERILKSAFKSQGKSSYLTGLGVN